MTPSNNCTAPVALTNVSKLYGQQRAANAVNFELYPGQCTVLAGHNGAGKSTVIKLILGLIRADEGKVTLLDHDAGSSQAARLRAHIGYLPETVALHPALTGTETLAFYARLKGLPTRDNQALLARVGIAQAAHKRVGTYSKGMRQRLALAQTLLGNPRVLLLDEPTTGLDPASRLLFYEIVQELRDAGATILLSTHALAEMERLADRIIVMQQGRKIADGTLSELRQHAGLPVRIRLTVEQIPDSVPQHWNVIGTNRLERHCTEAEKIQTLREAHAIQGLTDLELESPGLDELYAHFLKREDY